ncbi:hypothetical protein [Micromonospora humi]|uniref:Uncharacterized protein n=1 Tax=Micromonospora humi TaxID=745366 RepID=A0A1C5IWS2_9ACTN|nr:hypothetical protein [Micromonospora humi]SCG62409.1 hypothetical protein GA0070213_107204 [Micromonospora humi]
MSSGPVTTGVVVVAGAVALGLPALLTGIWVADGGYDFQDVLAMVALTALPAVVGAGAALLLGRRLVPRMRTSAGSPTAAARDALRAGRATDPAVDVAARREARRRLGQRWYVWLYAVLAAFQVSVVAGADRWASRLTAGVLAVCWSSLAWVRWRGVREARRYLDAAPVQPQTPTGADGDPSTPIGGGLREPAG